MGDSVKNKIACQAIQICKALITPQGVRGVERKHALFLTAAVKPWLHIVTGDEKVIRQDYQGYNMQFPIAFQFIFDENRDPYGVSDGYEAFIQSQFELDEQMGGLCSKITYNGSAPFILEELNPACLVVVMYLVEYRRMKAQPDVGY